MNEQKQDDQLEPIYNSSVPIQDVALKTYRERWTIEKSGKRGPGRSALAAWHDDDDDDDLYESERNSEFRVRTGQLTPRGHHRKAINLFVFFCLNKQCKKTRNVVQTINMLNLKLSEIPEKTRSRPPYATLGVNKPVHQSK